MRVNQHLVSQTGLYGLIGASAGLLVWAALNWHVYHLWHPAGQLSAIVVPGLVFQTILHVYVPLGILLGAAVAVIEPVRDTDLAAALRNEWTWLLRGILLGAAGGLLGGYLGEFVMGRFTAGADAVTTMRVWARLTGLIVTGLILGAALGLVDKWRTTSNDRLLAGLLGGSAGGLIAGLVFQFLVRRPEVMTVVAVMIFAAFLAGSIGSIMYLQTKARLMGAPQNIFKYREAWRKNLNADSILFIGSALPTRISQRTNFKIAQDLDIMPEHCTLEYDRQLRRWILARYHPSATELYVNSRPVKDAPVAIRDGDVITVGRTSFRFLLGR